jgi:hypothetical protein
MQCKRICGKAWRTSTMTYYIDLIRYIEISKINIMKLSIEINALH